MYFLLVLQQLIASTTHIIAKDVTSNVAPAVVLLFRAGLAATVFMIWITVIRRRLPTIEKKDIPRLLILGALNIPINQFLFVTSIEMTTAPNVALAYSLTPAFVFVIAVIFLKESASKVKLFGVILAFSGVLLVYLEKGFDFTSRTFTGNILVLIASFAWALYTVIGRDFSRKYGAIHSTSMAVFTGFLYYLVLFSFLPATVQFEQINTTSWLQIAYLGLITSVAGYAIWYYGLTKTEASKVAIFNNMQAIFTTILAMIFLGHELTVYFVIGGVMIITGVIMTQKG